MADPLTVIDVTVRYFAAARAAAGTSEERLQVPAGTTLAELVEQIGQHRPVLRQVLARCSYLHDEVAVRDPGAPMRPGSVVDVLPPFAGG